MDINKLKFLCGMIISSIIFYGCSSDKPFSSEKWKSTPEEDRYIFVEDIIEKNYLLNKTPRQIEEILGSPSSLTEHPLVFNYLVKKGGVGFDQVFVLAIYFDSTMKKSIRVRTRGD